MMTKGDAWEEYLEESQLYKLPWLEGKEPDFYITRYFV